MVSTLSHLHAVVLAKVMSLCGQDMLPLALQGFFYFLFPIPVGPTSTITQFSRQERPLSLEGLE